MTDIRRETGRMSELVNDLLLLARLDEHPALGTEPVDLTEIVLTAVDAARTVDPDRPIRVRINDVVEVIGDPMRLRQVVDNLLANIRAHTPAASPCEVALTVDDGTAVLTFTDSGPGVGEADLNRLFDRFYRVDDARSRTAGGSGLGLSIVEAIVTAHHGSISAANADPHGLVVEVRLPRATHDT
jgi:two-component system OmpR family sensor kinase